VQLETQISFLVTTKHGHVWVKRRPRSAFCDEISCFSQHWSERCRSQVGLIKRTVVVWFKPPKFVEASIKGAATTHPHLA
jgi:hypothetical protein